MLGLSQLNLQGIFSQWQGDTWLSTTTKCLKLKVKVKEQVNGRMIRQRKCKKYIASIVMLTQLMVFLL